LVKLFATKISTLGVIKQVDVSNQPINFPGE